MDPAPVAGILLAAGESSRMGRLKQLLPWQGTTLVRWQVDQMTAAGITRPIVVLGHQAREIEPALADSNAALVINESYREGRASSLRAGAHAVHDNVSAIVICSVDQPRSAWLIRELVDHALASNAAVVVPAHGSRRGHPTVLRTDLLSELREVTEETMGLRAVVQRHSDNVVEVQIENEVIYFDLNTPEDYERAFRQFGDGFRDR